MSKSRGRVRVEPGTKRVRTFLGGELIADTQAPKLVWEVPYYPAYYFPVGDVRMELLRATKTTSHSPSRGDARYFTVTGGNKEAVDAAWQYPDSPIVELAELIRFDWDAMDGWFEEDEEVFVHPRDPYTRVDILASSRRVRVEVDGVTVADSHQARLLFETGLPTRYYVPKTDVRMDLLSATDTVTQCPYKGTAETWAVSTADGLTGDLVWSYRAPVAESAKIAGLMCFYNEKVDIYLDGELIERPKTKFS